MESVPLATGYRDSDSTCSFCGKRRSQVGQVISGLGDRGQVYICKEMLAAKFMATVIRQMP